MHTLNPFIQSTKSVRFNEGTLILDGFGKQDDPRPQLGLNWKWRDEISAWHTQAYHYAETLSHLNGIEDKVPSWAPVTLYPKLPQLRDYQKEAKSRWMQSHTGLIVLPTGTGKTAVSLSIMSDLSVSTLILCPTRDLMYQWAILVENLLGVRPGIIGDSRWEIKDITVTTYHSACIKMPKIGNRFGLIIFDECHHLPGKIRSDSARLCAAPYRLGLTATPPHNDLIKPIEDVIGPVVYNMKLGQASGKVLAEYQTIRLTVKLAPEEAEQYHSLGKLIQEFVAGRRKTNRNFKWEDIQKELSNDAQCRLALAAHRKRNSIIDRATEKLDILEDLFRSHPKMTIIFTGSNVMAREVSKRFLIPCILSENARDERKQILKGFEDGTFGAVVTNKILDEGIDIPAAKVAIILGGTASSRQAEQRLGRILRKRGDIPATLYEIVCAETTEEKKSRTRRKSDAYHQ